MKFRHIDEIHKFFAGGGVGAFLAGLGTAVRNDQVDVECVYLSAICMFIRFKFWVDDREYFLRVEEGQLPHARGFQMGVVFGILSWMPWIVAGLAVSRENRCSAIMVLVFILSSCWIVSLRHDQRLTRLQRKWIFLNAGYGVLFFALALRDMLPTFFDNQQILPLLLETALLALALVDAWKSGTMIAVSKLIDLDTK